MINRRNLVQFVGAASSASILLDSNAAQPVRLVGALEDDPPFINPAVTTILTSFAAGSPVYGALTKLSSAGEVSPDLADSWEVSADGLAYTFRLNKDAMWHDGRPFTAEDVKFSIENVNSKIHTWGKATFNSLDRVDVADKHTAIIRLKQPRASLLSTLNIAICAILPKHLWEGTEILKNPLNKKPIGTGPFKFIEHVPGSHIRYERNEKFYHRGMPKFDELMLRIMPDASARIAAFEKGELDMLYSGALPTKEAVRVGQFPGVKLAYSKDGTITGATYNYVINTRAAPYGDKRVRKAMAHAIDRRYIRENILGIFAVESIGPVPPRSPLSNKKLVDYAFDAAKANALLDEAGFKRGEGGVRFPLKLAWSSNDVNITKMADVIKQNLAAIGIRVDLSPLEKAGLIQTAYVGGNFDVLIDFVALGPDPDIGVERFYNSKNILKLPFVNNSGYSNAEIDALFDQQRAQPDLAKRKAIYDRIQEIIWDDLPVFPLSGQTSPSVMRTSAVTDIFEGIDSSKESFENARAGATSSGSASHAQPTAAWWGAGAAAALALAGAGIWVRSRSRRDDDEAAG